jgi:hypothetical protein
VDILTLFGVVCVSLMLVAYALEERGGGFVMLFAFGCMGSSIYGFLVGAWPFGIVEAVWTVVAVRRWRSRVRDGARTTTKPIACDMTALSAVQRQRYDALRRLVLDSVEQVTGTTTGFRLRLRSKAPAADVAEWMALEHKCCPFLTLQLALKDDESRWIEIGGSAAIKAFLEEEFKAFATV